MKIDPNCTKQPGWHYIELISVFAMHSDQRQHTFLKALRSDGTLVVSKHILDEHPSVEQLQELFEQMEEFRVCLCTGQVTCEKHRVLEESHA